jgi:hypothetical protein
LGFRLETTEGIGAVPALGRANELTLWSTRKETLAGFLLMGRRGFADNSNYAPLLPVELFLGAFLALACFLVFFVFGAVLLVELLPAGAACGFACATKINGMVATASAIASKLFFISFFSLAGLTARSQFHDGAGSPKSR